VDLILGGGARGESIWTLRLRREDPFARFLTTSRMEKGEGGELERGPGE